MSTACSRQAGPILALVLLLAGAAPAGAQVVRGRITEVRSGAPVSGVLVSLVADPSGEAVVSVLSSRDGDYAVRAPAPGQYRLAAKRIGVRRYESAPFTLGTGETRAIEVTVDAIAMALPEVTVSGLCVTRQRDLGRVASLWDEVRTALTATAVSQRDQLARASIVRYAAELDPGSLRPLFEWRSDVEIMTDRPFTSRSGDSLSLLGYWRVLPGDSVEFQAPDAAALASDAFLRDHCFSPGAASRDRPGEVALDFAPARDRDLPDIEGTIRVDGRSFELRVVEFRYTRLPRTPDARFIGGEVHFRRLDTGAWIVDRWFIRMPQEVVRSDDLPRRQLREEGGVLIAEGARGAAGASLAGVVRDSSGRPVADAIVRVLGHPAETRTAPDGTWRLDGLAPGSVSIVVRTPAYDAHGVLAGARRLTVRAGQVGRADFRAPTARAMIDEFCSNRRFSGQRSTLRVLVVDSASGAPQPGVTLRASWSSPPFPGAPDRASEARVRTDARGAATFCYIPAGVEVEVAINPASGESLRLFTAHTERGWLEARVAAVRAR